MKINHYPEPFIEQYPNVRPTDRHRIEASPIRQNLWQVRLSNGDVWQLDATDYRHAITQAKQLQRLAKEGVL